MVQDNNTIKIDTDRMALFAQNIVRIPSFTFQESELAQFIFSYLLGAGFDVELQTVSLPGEDTSQQVVARWQGSGENPKCILCGHLDIMDVYRQDQWTFDPFCGDIVNGWLRGVGSLNMKAGIATIISAVEALKESGIKPKGEIVIALVMGEIVGGVGINHLLREENSFDYGLVAEPTNLCVSNISVGTCQGIVRLWGDTQYFKPHQNPINATAKLIDILGPAYAPQNPGNWMNFEICTELPGFPRFNVRKISSGQDFCEIFFDARIVPGQTNATLKSDLQRLVNNLEQQLPGIQGEIIIPIDADTTNFPAMPSTPDNCPFIISLAAAHKKVTGDYPLISAGDRIGLASDAAHMKKANILAVDYGPGKHPRWPMVDECVKVQDMITAAQTLAEALYQTHK